MTKKPSYIRHNSQSGGDYFNSRVFTVKKIYSDIKKQENFKVEHHIRLPTSWLNGSKNTTRKLFP